MKNPRRKQPASPQPADEAGAFDLLARMRFACGDNGARMQDELETYLRELKLDAERYRALRFAYLAQSPRWADIINQTPVFNQITFDRAIDAAMAGDKRRVTSNPTTERT